MVLKLDCGQNNLLKYFSNIMNFLLKNNENFSTNDVELIFNEILNLITLAVEDKYTKVVTGSIN